VRRTQGGTFIDAWCDQCDWRTEYITPVAAGLDAKAHAETNPTHTARWRRVEHRAYQAELS
jgi:hypothetical protein